MIDKKMILIDKISNNLLSNLESRDVALWVSNLPKEPAMRDAFVSFLGLPWRMVFSETFNQALVKSLEAAAQFDDPLTRKRGYIQIIDSDPSRLELPQRCLPLYFLNGRQTAAVATDFESRLRRMTMLENLRRSGVRELIVFSGDDDPVPAELKELWSAGFRSYLTFVSASENADKKLETDIGSMAGVVAVNLLRLPSDQVVKDILSRYSATYPEDRHVIRMRDGSGRFHAIDVTQADEPERPILDYYSLLKERDLTPLMPGDLSQEEFVGFFRDPEGSWRPYAAGLPWVRDTECKKSLNHYLQKLDTAGSEENCITYIASESGAGGTTLARVLAWELAREGYPVLAAKAIPFVPDALPVANFLTRVHRDALEQMRSGQKGDQGTAATQTQDAKDANSRHYETPWVIVFDGIHWQHRDSELVRFRNELVKSGRPVCVLLVTGTVLGLSFFNTAIFKKIAELNHAIDQSEARQLGSHLNQFLRVYGRERQESEWDRFYQEHTVRYLAGTAAFWVTLSFWLQGQYNLSESIQQWMYKLFLEKVSDPIMQNAILEIAALSSERLPMPEGLLPESKGKWPLSHLLEDSRSSLAGLGLIRVSADGEKYWALIHDILGRFLINALFYDFEKRSKLGFASAKDAEHLRLLLLRQISQKPFMGEKAYRSIGEDFATTILKIDPDHGHGSFSLYWREVLDSLDNMPRTLRDTSRVFRHHTGISRRRVAKMDENLYGIKKDDKIVLLNKAIEDIKYALTFIAYTPGSESNLNLYNSLANAYFDLLDIETAQGASSERIIELRQLANDATRKAYEESPTNSYVIETYVKNLLQSARDSSAQAVELCIEALGIIYAATVPGEVTTRELHLNSLADQALQLLFQQRPEPADEIDPVTPIDVLLKAWKTLSDTSDHRMGLSLSDVSEERRLLALDVLANTAGKGNMQIIRLSYDLVCIGQPFSFKQQLEFVEQLQATNFRITPQLRLEYAILLFQTGRPVEGDKVFRTLRQIWRESENFVHIPERLRWLRTIDGSSLQTVQAITGSDYGYRSMARVQEFGNVLVPFRPEEHGFRELKPGLKFACHVSFGHNGPFLRPVTTKPA